MKASKFIEKMFAGRTKGNVFLCTYANDRSEAKKFPPRDLATRDWAKADAFVKEFDVAGRAVYFACCTMMGRVRNKEEVAHINSVFCDLDFKGIVESEADIIKALQSLACPPSVVVHSGNGLHCYWLLEPAQNVEHSASCEDLMRRICAALAGDVSAAEVARVLRLPGSHNSKNGDWKLVDVVAGLTTWRTYSFAKLDKHFNDIETLLTYKVTKKREVEIVERVGPRNVYQQLMYDIRADYGQPFDAQEFLDKMTYHDTQGHGIDATHAHIIGAMVAQGSTIKECLDVLLAPTKAVYKRDKASGDPAWNEKQEIADIKKKFNRFTKNDAKKEKEDKAPAPKPKTPEPETKGKKKHDYDEDPPEEIAAQRERSRENEWGMPIVDLFSDIAVPRMERQFLPQLIADIAFSNAEIMAGDPGALAMSLLTGVSAVISTKIKVKVRAAEHNDWKESARIWTLLIGEAGSTKSPLMRAAIEPLTDLDFKLGKDFIEEDKVYKAVPKDEKDQHDKPVRRTVIFNNVSIEAATDSLLDNPAGALFFSDEARAIFGTASKYAGKGNNGAEHSGRAFLLSAYNSEYCKVMRIGRGEKAGYPSISMLGSTQPDVLYKLAAEAENNDGMIQRLNPVFIPESLPDLSEDESPSHPFALYHDLIKKLFNNPLQHGTTIRFSQRGQEWMNKMMVYCRDAYNLERVTNPQLATSYRKLEAMYARFCLIYHMIEHAGDHHASPISAETAKQVYLMMQEYQIKHVTMLHSHTSVNEEHNILRNIIRFALSRKLPTLYASDLAAGSLQMRNMERKDLRRYMEKLEALRYGRILMQGKKGRHDSIGIELNPVIFETMKHIGDAERKRRAEEAEMRAARKAQEELDRGDATLQ
jgi:hypothetical protein